jgi:hypothetical protein
VWNNVWVVYCLNRSDISCWIGVVHSASLEVLILGDVGHVVAGEAGPCGLFHSWSSRQDPC